MTDRILHLVPAAYYTLQPETKPYVPEGFAAEGFIHCTAEADVLLRVANGLFAREPGEFLVLVIDPSRVSAPVRYEPPIPPPPAGVPLADHLFPHIYGPLNREAIVAVRAARREADGTFVEV